MHASAASSFTSLVVGFHFNLGCHFSITYISQIAWNHMMSCLAMYHILIAYVPWIACLDGNFIYGVTIVLLFRIADWLEPYAELLAYVS